MPCPNAEQIRRASRRATVAVPPPQLDPVRIGEAVLGVFRRFDYTALDLEALIYFTLQAFEVHPASYESVYKSVRQYVMKNFAIQQGRFMGFEQMCMSRLIVCYTDTEPGYEKR